MPISVIGQEKIPAQQVEEGSIVQDMDVDPPKITQDDLDDVLPDLLFEKDCPHPPQKITRSQEDTRQSYDSLKEDTASRPTCLNKGRPFLIQLPDSIRLGLSKDGTTPKDNSTTSSQPSTNVNCGEIYIHRSGKASMRIGDLILDLSSIPTKNYYQSAAFVSNQQKTCSIISEISECCLATPNVSSLLKTLSYNKKA